MSRRSIRFGGLWVKKTIVPIDGVVLVGLTFFSVVDARGIDVVAEEIN